MLRVRPWIGDGYRRRADALKRTYKNEAYNETDIAAGLGIHVMGESHYCDDGTWGPDFSERVIRDRALIARPTQLFRKLENAIGDGLLLDESARRGSALWDRLAFSNFIQRPLPAPRAEIPDDFWVEGRDLFSTQLRATCPEILIVFGWRTWQHLPREGAHEFYDIEPFKSPSIKVPEALVYTYEVNDVVHGTVAVPICHPSGRGYRRAEAAGRVLTILLASCGLIADPVLNYQRDSETGNAL